jgi:hypothetical protein
MTDDIDPAVPVAAAITPVTSPATTFKVRIDAAGRVIELETTQALGTSCRGQ